MHAKVFILLSQPNGELVDEDTKEILTGILETTQRLNTYNCTKALLEQL